MASRTHYGLGVTTSAIAAVVASLAHGGEVSGFTAKTRVLPDDRAAIVVLTNQDAAERLRRDNARRISFRCCLRHN